MGRSHNYVDRIESLGVLGSGKQFPLPFFMTESQTPGSLSLRPVANEKQSHRTAFFRKAVLFRHDRVRAFRLRLQQFIFSRDDIYLPRSAENLVEPVFFDG